MTALLLVPAALSLVVLAAHFLFHQMPILTLASLALIALLFVRAMWAKRVVQVVLVIGALEWVRTMLVSMHARQANGEDYLRMAIILSAVAAVSLIAAALFETPPLRRRFKPSIVDVDEDVAD